MLISQSRIAYSEFLMWAYFPYFSFLIGILKRSTERYLLFVNKVIFTLQITPYNNRIIWIVNNVILHYFIYFSDNTKYEMWKMCNWTDVV